MFPEKLSFENIFKREKTTFVEEVDISTISRNSLINAMNEGASPKENKCFLSGSSSLIGEWAAWDTCALLV